MELSSEDRKIFITYVFGHLTGHNHNTKQSDIANVINNEFIEMYQQPLSQSEYNEVIDSLASTDWFRHHTTKSNREIKRVEGFRVNA